MGLLTLDQVMPRLLCPCCRTPVARLAERVACGNAGCDRGHTRSFPCVGSHPALVDFERSIVSEADLKASAGASTVPRIEARGVMRHVRDLYAPPNRVAERHATQMKQRLAAAGSRPTLLVVGGGTVGSGAASLYSDDGLDVIAFDVYASPYTQFIADAHDIPLADRSVDAVWVQAVLEHVLDPWRVVSEIERVLTDEGLVYAETPFLQQVHEGAYDFMRFTESGQRWLFRRFERLDSGVVAGPGTQIAWSIDYATRALFRSALAGRMARLLSSGVHLLDRLVPARFAVDDAACVFFFGRKTKRELSPREIVEHYRGAQKRSA